MRALAPGHWRLSIPSGPGGRFRLAQLDDYLPHPRSAFRWRPPLRLQLRARASHTGLPGTWGFGFWNDPFSVSMGLGGTARRLPALPNAAWFFHASPPNYLALRDTHPANGFLAATFSSLRVPAPLLALGVPVLPLLAWPLAARYLRRLACKFVREDAARLETDPDAWHAYVLEWRAHGVRFSLDGALCLETATAPRFPLGLVLWIDSQYAAFPPTGRLRLGTLPVPECAWLDVADIEVATLRTSAGGYRLPWDATSSMSRSYCPTMRGQSNRRIARRSPSVSPWWGVARKVRSLLSRSSKS